MNNDTPQRLAASAIDAVMAAYGREPLALNVLSMIPTVREAVTRAVITAYVTGLATGATLAAASSPTPAPDAGKE